MINKLSELIQILKDNKIEGYCRCNKPQLIELLRGRDLLPKEVEKPVSGAQLKTIRNNPKHVTLTDVKLNIKYNFPSIYKAACFIKRSPRIITFWSGRVWNNKYLVTIDEDKVE